MMVGKCLWSNSQTDMHVQVVSRLCLLLAVELLAGCTDNKEKLIDLIEKAPKSIIDLDEFKEVTLYPSLIIGDLEPQESTRRGSEIFLGMPTGCIVANDSIYIVDRINNCIIVSDKRGNLIRKIGRKGQGPGEFLRPHHILRNDRHVFVYDMMNRRVQIFDTLFNYTGSIVAGFPASATSPAATNARIYIPGNLADSSLIKVYSAQAPFNFLYSFLPRAVPIDQPTMNAVRIAANENGEYCYAFTALPFIYICDSLERRVGSIEFRSDYADEILKANSGGTRGITQFFNGLLLLNNGTIIAASRSEVNFIEREDGKHRLKYKFHLAFEKTSSMKERREGVPIYSLFYDHGLLYVCSGIAGSYVLCYKIPV